MTTRTLVVLAWIWACGSNTDPMDLVEGGRLIALDEGGPARTLDLTSEAHLVGTIPSWAHSDDGHHLVLDPGCDAIMGTSGPPQEFQLVLEIAATKVQVPVVVDVRPSGEGACRLRVAVCLEAIQNVGSGNPDGLDPCNSSERRLARDCGSDNGLVDGRIVIGFGSAGGSGTGNGPFSRPTILDKALAISFTDPGCTPAVATCDPLEVVFSTDAPFKVHRETTGSANTPAGREYCAAITNENITGGFGLTYSIVRGDPMTGAVVTGDRNQVVWNEGPRPQPYGAQLVWCAADGTSEGACRFTRSFGSGPQQWMVHKCKPNANLTIGMRLWANKAPSGDQYDLHVAAALAGSNASIGLLVPPRRGDGALAIPTSAALFPLDLILDLSTLDNGTVVLDLVGSGSGIGSDFTQTFERQIVVDTTGLPCN